MIDLDSDLLILRIEVHVTHLPRGRQAMNVLVELLVLHLGAFSRQFYHYLLKSRMDRKNSAEHYSIQARRIRGESLKFED